MKLVFKKLSALSVGVLALVASLNSAQAVTLGSATASLTNLKVTLVDLDPSDGIAPSATFGPGLLATFFQQNAVFADGINQETGGLFNPTAASGSDGKVSYELSATGITLSSVSDSADLPPADTRAVRSVSLSSGVIYRNIGDPDPEASFPEMGRFTLGANTGMVISGSADVSAAGPTSADVQAADIPALFNDSQVDMSKLLLSFSTSAVVDLFISSALNADGDYEGDLPNGTTGSFRRAASVNGVDSPEDSGSGSFALTLTNASAESLEAVVSFGMTASTRVFASASRVTVPEVPAIPEPSTYLLMGLGLAGIGFARSRQQSKGVK